MNERRNLFVGAAEDLPQSCPCNKGILPQAAQGKALPFSVFARHTYADQKAHGRRHFIRQLTEMIRHAFDVTNILKTQWQTQLFQFD